MRTTIATLAAAIVIQAIAIAGPHYSTDFSSNAGPEWSRTDRDTTPSGEDFLGRFTNDESVALSLTDLPTHDTVFISISLYVIHSWDGVQPSGNDIWRLRLSTGEVLLETTFANELEGATNFQNYPDSLGGTLSPSRTGAAASNSLGYFEMSPRRFGDTIYELAFEVPHSAESIEIIFEADGWTGSGTMGLGDESWGVDNVAVDFSGASCEGDVNGDMVVNFTDLNAILGLFGWVEDNHFADLNGNGIVDFSDLNIVLSAFGNDCR